jgi:hypothetical protein
MVSQLATAGLCWPPAGSGVLLELGLGTLPGQRLPLRTGPQQGFGGSCGHLRGWVSGGSLTKVRSSHPVWALL